MSTMGDAFFRAAGQKEHDDLRQPKSAPASAKNRRFFAFFAMILHDFIDFR